MTFKKVASLWRRLFLVTVAAVLLGILILIGFLVIILLFVVVLVIHITILLIQSCGYPAVSVCL